MNDNKKIWIVDDDAIAVTIVCYLVEQTDGLDLAQKFDCAEDVLKALSNGAPKPDLIILDLNMPMMSGWDLLDQMKTREEVSGIRIVVFTSSIDERDRKRSANYSNVIGHFVKPMTRKMLNDIVIQINQ